MAIQKAGKQQFQDVFTVVGVGAFTIDFANAATGSGTFAATTVTVPGAALGDIVLVGNGVDTTAGGAIVGHVSAADTVRLNVLNNTAGALDLASATYVVAVLRVNPQYAVV